MQPPALKTWSIRGLLGVLDVEDHQPLLAGRDVGVGPGQVDGVGVGQRERRDRPGVGQVGDVEDLDPLLVADVARSGTATCDGARAAGGPRRR